MVSALFLPTSLSCWGHRPLAAYCIWAAALFLPSVGRIGAHLFQPRASLDAALFDMIKCTELQLFYASACLQSYSCLMRHGCSSVPTHKFVVLRPHVPSSLLHSGCSSVPSRHWSSWCTSFPNFLLRASLHAALFDMIKAQSSSSLPIYSLFYASVCLQLYSCLLRRGCRSVPTHKFVVLRL